MIFFGIMFIVAVLSAWSAIRSDMIREEIEREKKV